MEQESNSSKSQTELRKTIYYRKYKIGIRPSASQVQNCTFTLLYRVSIFRTTQNTFLSVYFRFQVLVSVDKRSISTDNPYDITYGIPVGVTFIMCIGISNHTPSCSVPLNLNIT
jgi:hypothetical protein